MLNLFIGKHFLDAFAALELTAELGSGGYRNAARNNADGEKVHIAVMAHFFCFLCKRFFNSEHTLPPEFLYAYYMIAKSVFQDVIKSFFNITIDLKRFFEDKNFSVSKF